MNKPALSERRVLRGQIRNYRVQRTTEDFFLSASERKGMAITGLAASAIGLIGVGVALMGESTDTYEEADLADFEINGEPIQAFLWMSPFQEGDDVEVVAEKSGDTWKAFGIVRPADRIIALHPHCSRGTKAHWRMVVRWWWWSSVVIVAIGSLLALIVGLFDWSGLRDLIRMMIIIAFGGGGLFFLVSAIIAWTTGRKYRGFVRMAEIVFSRLGWRDVENIDLPMLSRRLRKPDDPEELGSTYFRY